MIVNAMFQGDWMRNFQTTLPDLLASGIKGGPAHCPGPNPNQMLNETPVQLCVLPTGILMVALVGEMSNGIFPECVGGSAGLLQLSGPCLIHSLLRSGLLPTTGAQTLPICSPVFFGPPSGLAFSKGTQRQRHCNTKKDSSFLADNNNALYHFQHLHTDNP